MPTQQQAAAAFSRFDAAYFSGTLAASTAVAVKAMPSALSGGNHSGGTVIEINATDPNWEETLIHEMVHATEFQFPQQITLTPEGVNAHRVYSMPAMRLFYDEHSAMFFSKLFEVMKARGHDPSRDFDRYFG